MSDTERDPNFPRMLFQVGDQEEMHGGRFNYILVHDNDALEAMIDSGWYMTTCHAKEAAGKPVQAVAETVAIGEDGALLDRSALEARATELGVKFDGRTSDRKLNTLIIEKLG